MYKRITDRTPSATTFMLGNTRVLTLKRIRVKINACKANSGIRLSIDFNTLMKPYERKEKNPMKNQAYWSDEDYARKHTANAATLDQQLTQKVR